MNEDQKQATLNLNLFYQSIMDRTDEALDYVKSGADVAFDNECIFLECAKRGNTQTFIALLDYHQIKNEKVLLEVIEQDNYHLLPYIITHFTWSEHLETIYQRSQNDRDLLLSAPTLKLLKNLRLLWILSNHCNNINNENSNNSDMSCVIKL
jgi:hypothetical protein